MTRIITRMYAKQLSENRFELIQEIEKDTLALNKKTMSYEGGFETEEKTIFFGTLEQVSAYESLRCNNVTIEMLNGKDNKKDTGFICKSCDYEILTCDNCGELLKENEG